MSTSLATGAGDVRPESYFSINSLLISLRHMPQPRQYSQSAASPFLWEPTLTRNNNFALAKIEQHTMISISPHTQGREGIQSCHLADISHSVGVGWVANDCDNTRLHSTEYRCQVGQPPSTCRVCSRTRTLSDLQKCVVPKQYQTAGLQQNRHFQSKYSEWPGLLQLLLAFTVEQS